jgi:chaperonin GroES
MLVKPLHNYVLVEPAKREEMTKGGIALPNNALDKESPVRGTVVAVGPGRYEYGAMIPMWVKAGDVALYRQYVGDEIEVDGKKLVLVSVNDVLAIIT